MTNTGMIDTGKECKSFPQPTKSNSNTDIALKRLGFSYPQGKFHLQIREEVVIASALAEAQGHKGMFNFRDRHFINAIRTGQTMEDIAKELKAVNQEVSESKTILKNLSNEISAIQDIVHPQLIKQIKEIRESRMSLVSEVGESLKTLRDIRKFFLETDYEKEMERLERFIRVCKEILELKRNGIFDDICDSAIRMAVREEKKEEKHERE